MFTFEQISCMLDIFKMIAVDMSTLNLKAFFFKQNDTPFKEW